MITTQIHQHTVTIIIDEHKFGYHCRIAFSKAKNIVLSAHGARVIEIDLHNVHKLDCAALGMILILEEKAKLLHKSIVLKIGNNHLILPILLMTKFDTRFKVI